jgi:AcrR family transcriptional regulator
MRESDWSSDVCSSDLKKKESEEKITSSARDIFLKKGYNNTTMEEIAAKADMGVGTLYNYFKSKAEIFISIMVRESLINETDDEADLKLEKDPATIIIDYILRSTSYIEAFDKNLWIELFAAMLGNANSDNSIITGLVNMDFKFIQKLDHLLNSLKEKGRLPQSFKSNEAAYAIYSIILTQIIMYIYTERATFEVYRTNVKNQISFLFEGKY